MTERDLQATTGSEERLQALLRNSNTRLLAHPEARRRLLQLKGTVALLPFQGNKLSVHCFQLVVPTSGTVKAYPTHSSAGVRLIEDDVSSVPFSEAYETHCARYGREADAPILAFKARCCSSEGLTTDSTARLAAYQEIVDKLVTENIFSQFMYKTMVENNLSMWIIKKQFALSVAMSGEIAMQLHWLPNCLAA